MRTDLPGAAVSLDLTAADDPTDFFAAPYPMDARLDADGHPRIGELPGLAETGPLAGVAVTAGELRGYPTTPVGWFRFSSAPRPGDDTPIAASADSPVLLLDLDADGCGGASLLPVVAKVLPPDPHVPNHLLAVAPVPGVILRPEHTHALVVLRRWNDIDGAPLGTPADVLRLLHGEAPEDTTLDPLRTDAERLADALSALGLTPEDVAAFTTFTTGDAVADTYALTEAVRAAHQPRIDGLALAPDRGVELPGYCELHGTLDVPEFQRGLPPYDTEGTFELDADGVPIAQRTTTIPVVVTVPHGEMPAGGWPLALYFHGSGGTSDQLVIRGPRGPGAPAEDGLGYGPAWVLASYGIAGAGSAHPVNPERLPGASSIAYLNFFNLGAFRDTFRQGVIEQRLYLDALLALEIDPDVLVGCAGPTLPDGADAFRFDAANVVAMGQSMGGMYTNLIGAVEPRIRAVVPTGAGGHWTRFILETELLGPGVGESLVQAMIGTRQPLSYLHPVLQVAQTAWEPSEPMVSMPRLALDPLPGAPVRPIYEPVGLGDSYFPPPVFDAMALAYGNKQAGDEVWPSMQDALALVGRDGLGGWPQSENRRSRDGTAYTGVVAQYEGDGFSDPHNIFTQLATVRRQYGCFFDSFLRTGVAVVPDGTSTGDCPTAAPAPDDCDD